MALTRVLLRRGPPSPAAASASRPIPDRPRPLLGQLWGPSPSPFCFLGLPGGFWREQGQWHRGRRSQLGMLRTRPRRELWVSKII